MNEIPKLFETPKENFIKHLEAKNNTRILFSGMYGIGKTTFLNNFFLDEDFKNKYNSFHLFPVNYSVLQNEDIFSYLKYDIFYEIIIKYKFAFEERHYSSQNLGYFFTIQNIDKLLASFLLFIPKLGKQLFQFQNEIRSLKQAFTSFKKIANSKENEELKDFIASFHNIEGQLYEHNSITELIKIALESLKENTKENILIIDDLDRIDPNHIFRLFNVFAAHFDQRNLDTNNKFGFDRVIFVCDTNNIREIFRSQYGIKVDFNGYIDKFYSKKIFHFDNKENVIGIIDNLVSNITFKSNHTGLDKRFVNWNRELRRNLKTILKDIVTAGHINLRQILKFGEIEIKLSWFVIYKAKVSNLFYLFLLTIDVLKEYFGSADDLIEILEKCKPIGESWDYEYIMHDIILFAELKKHKFHSLEGGYGSEPIEYKLEVEKNIINYNVIGYSSSGYRENIYHLNNTDRNFFDLVKLYPSFIQAIKNIEEQTQVKIK